MVFLTRLIERNNCSYCYNRFCARV